LNGFSWLTPLYKSRLDAYFGDNADFNQAVFDETRSYWTDEIINITTGAAALAARKATSNATNPTYELSDLGTGFGFGETAAYILILGNKTTSTVNRTLVEYLFGKLITPCIGNMYDD
jgi:hypothetical protein